MTFDNLCKKGNNCKFAYVYTRGVSGASYIWKRKVTYRIIDTWGKHSPSSDLGLLPDSAKSVLMTAVQHILGKKSSKNKLGENIFSPSSKSFDVFAFSPAISSFSPAIDKLILTLWGKCCYFLTVFCSFLYRVSPPQLSHLASPRINNQ